MELKIGELAKRVNINPKTIRYYEELGLVSSKRAPNKYRLYSLEAESTLLFIKRAKKLGLSLLEIHTIIGEVEQGYCDSAKRQISKLLSTKISEVDTQVTELLGLKSYLVDRLIQIEQAGQKRPNDSCSCLGDNSY